MGRNLYKLTKKLMTSSSEYLENGSTDFHQTYVIFRQSYIEVFEIKRLKIGH